MLDMPEITPVRSSHRFDEASLTSYLKANRPEFSGPLEIHQFEGGQSNPTFVLSFGKKQYVMRKKPTGKILPSAHQIDREYRVMKALADTDVIVPKMHLLCQDTSIIGTEFYIMEMVEGRVIPKGLLPNLKPKERSVLYDHFIEQLAALHKVDYQAVGLEEFGRPGNYFARQISRWSKQYIASKTEELENMEKLMEWLPENIPDDDETTLVHGDYRFGNVIIHPTHPQIVAILDWELSTIGHPMGDLAYSCMGYYGDLKYGELNKDAKTLKGLGIPTDQEFLARYCELTGRKQIEHWHFYIIYNFFRAAAIVQGVYKRGLDGNASSNLAITMGEVCKDRSKIAWELVEQHYT